MRTPVALVVVTQREKPEEQKQLRAAGADLLCDPGTPDALILKELHGRCQAQEVPAEVRQQLAEPLITAFCQATKEMTAVEFAVQSVLNKTEDFAEGVRAVAQRRPGNFKGR